MITELAYAKINLFLDVVGLRKDGFHEINTVMQTVSLADSVFLDAVPNEKKEISLVMEGCDLPTDERNLAYRAAAEYMNAAQLNARVALRVQKRIPMAAGLAGGSSDAAAVLRGLERIFGALGREKLLNCAAHLGSDVPFCLLGGTRLCRGRGEVMTEVKTLLPKNYVLFCSGEAVSTPEAFRKLDEVFAPWKSDGGEKYARFLVDPAQGGYNIFESVVLPTCARANAAKKELLRLGAKSALMSGSGATVFGIFESKEHALIAAERIGGIAVTSVGTLYNG